MAARTLDAPMEGKLSQWTWARPQKTPDGHWEPGAGARPGEMLRGSMRRASVVLVTGLEGAYIVGRVN
jgi:hypothetical protein